MSQHPADRVTRRSGFTLIEILIVVVILGILASIIVPQFADAQSSTRAAAMRTQLKTIRGQVSAWRIQNGNGMPGGSSATASQMMQTLIDDGYIVRKVFLSPGFIWEWNPTTGALNLSYNEVIEPSIPDANNDGEGDSADIDLIESW